MESTAGWCLHVYKAHPERYAVPEGNTTHYNESLCNATNYDTEKYNWANDFCPTDYSWMAVLGLALFVIAFAPGSSGRSLAIYFLFTPNGSSLIKWLNGKYDVSLVFACKHPFMYQKSNIHVWQKLQNR